MRDEVLKYCTLDCEVLYKILEEFSILIFDTFNVNLDKSPTLLSLALKIYRSKFIPAEEMIYL